MNRDGWMGCLIVVTRTGLFCSGARDIAGIDIECPQPRGGADESKTRRKNM